MYKAFVEKVSKALDTGKYVIGVLKKSLIPLIMTCL